MIRVLHVVSSLGTGSGVASFIMSYYREIDREKIQFDFLSFKKRDGSFEKEILELGGGVYYCSKPSLSLAFRHEMNHFFNAHKNEYQIMHCHPIYAAGIFSPYAKKSGIKRIISHSHTTKYSENKKSALRNFFLLSLIGRRATDFVACSEDAKRIFYWKKKEDVTLIKNAVNIEKFRFSKKERDEIRMKLGIDQDEIVIGHIGRFTTAKNHIFLLQVFKNFLDNHQNAKLLLLGDGDLYEQMVQQANELKIVDRVIFAGRKENVVPYLSAMDIFIFPSNFEGLGIVLVEAQLNGLPCLASTKVPREADITGNVLFESLKSEYRTWVNDIELLITKKFDRSHIEMIDETMDISYAVKILENYYAG